MVEPSESNFDENFTFCAVQTLTDKDVSHADPPNLAEPAENDEMKSDDPVAIVEINEEDALVKQTLKTESMESCCITNDDNSFVPVLEIPDDVQMQDSTRNEEFCAVNQTFEESHIDSFKFNSVPIQITGAWKEFDSFDNYTRGCKWAPDGSCLLTCSNDNALRLFNFPSELWQENFDWGDVAEMTPALSVSEGGCIYDFAWYPNMSSSDPDTSCFCTTSHNSPVHLWDAFTGQLRCSYKPYNHVDEVATPSSIAFDSSGQYIYCGFRKMIRIFDVSIPGRDCMERSLCAKKRGQAGIISCFAFCPALPNISAIGSYNKTIGIYSETSGYLEGLLTGHKGGVTHLMFSADGTKLYSGGRKDLEILCWDMRNLGSVLFGARRLCLTNQRLYFDISKCGRYMISGNNNGVVTVWDLLNTPQDLPNAVQDLPNVHPVLHPASYYQAHDDCVNGVSFHPTVPVIATCSGQRKFPEPVDSDDDESNCDSISKEFMFTYKHLVKDNSVRLWLASGV